MLWGRGIGSEFGFGHLGGYSATSVNRPILEKPGNTVWRTTGRSAIAAAIASVSEKRRCSQRNTFLLPSYLCSSIIQPFRDSGLNVRFYPISESLTIDLEAVPKQVDEDTLGILLIRYFGFDAQPDLTKTVHRLFPDLTIIDDRTHLLLSDLASGYSPDAEVVVYSIRKWGPFPDLGLVVFPKDGDRYRHLADTGRKRTGDWFFLLRTLGISMRTAYFLFPIAGLRSISLRPFQWAENILDETISDRPPSGFTKWLWQHWDWPSAWKQRRENCMALLENWPDCEAKPIFRSLSLEASPLGFPIAR